MGVGDEILAAGQAQRIWDSSLVHPRSKIAIVDLNHKARWHPIWDGNPILATPADVAALMPVMRLLSAPGARPYITYPFTEATGWTFNRSFRAREHIAKIYLTAEETDFAACARAKHGSFVLIEPWSKHNNLRWPEHHWLDLVDALHRRGLQVAQHTHASTGAPLANVDLTFDADFRHACALVAVSSVYIRGESGMLHAAAALGAHSVAIWGGCMDWDVLGGYPNQHGIGIHYPPCGSWMPCTHCAAIMSAITPDDVMAGVVAALYAQVKTA